MTTNPNPNLQPLTAKEKLVLEFIEDYLSIEGVAPTYREIKDHFGFSSFNSVQRYLKQLAKKQYLALGHSNQKRAITVLRSARAVQSSMSQMHAAHHVNATGASSEEPLSLPLLGAVAAGRPIEAYEHDEFLPVPTFLVKHPSRSFALEVQGDSMIDDGIWNGDYILVQEQKSAQNGNIVVATVDDEATVKRFFRHTKEKQIELRPANSEMQSFWYANDEVQVRGVVVGLIRNFLS